MHEVIAMMMVSAGMPTNNCINNDIMLKLKTSNFLKLIYFQDLNCMIHLHRKLIEDLKSRIAVSIF